MYSPIHTAHIQPKYVPHEHSYTQTLDINSKAGVQSFLLQHLSKCEKRDRNFKRKEKMTRAEAWRERTREIERERESREVREKTEWGWDVDRMED